MVYKNSNDNIDLVALNKAQAGYGLIEVRAGRMVDLVMVAVVAAAVHEKFVNDPSLFLGEPEMEQDSKNPCIQHLSPFDAAEWACTKTAFAEHLPKIITASGASKRPKDAMPFVISALARHEPFVTAVAFRCQGVVAPSAIAEEKLYGYLEQHGTRLVFEILKKFSKPTVSCTLMLRQLREMIVDKHRQTSIGKLMPTAGLDGRQVDEVLEDWMLEHDDRIHELLGFPPFDLEND
ncbi:hypothetical protein Sa4125_30360 [Aureimonas sp. SA4125]|uniref:hypothetical protein n=1 Tax=Aureimonas sp. SA4125 TaxID=2826993 RepID=UPI001CC5530B|nr:hypothetical protein [Aureimonas sp. SA4125]BDA85494.1 hypothetical protein Sa4125_30360 [Aureimonas sp. SA4125]